METIIYFVLGILTASGVFLLGYASVGVFRTTNKIKNLEAVNDILDRKINDFENQIHQRIDMDIQSCNNYIDEVQSNLHETEKDIISLLDRRMDKLENKFKSNFSDSDIDKLGYDLYKLKEEMDGFIRAYQNQ
jgi:peptidoglycan hydrolase CwlO-like protein